MTILCETLDRAKPRKSGRYADLIQWVGDRPGHDRRYAIDPSKIEKELGWRPRCFFETAIGETVEWYLSHQDWVEEVGSENLKDWIATHYAFVSSA